MGLLVSGDGTVIDVIHDSPAYKAGIGPGMKIVAVNGAQYSSDAIRGAIGNAKSSTEPMQIITSNGARIETRAWIITVGTGFRISSATKRTRII